MLDSGCEKIYFSGMRWFHVFFLLPLTAWTQPSFDQLHQLIQPQPGESRWMEIEWHPSIWEARQLAAKQGKPIFFMAGSGGAPAAGC